MGSASLAYFELTPDDAAIPGSTGLSSNVGLSYRVSPRLSGTLGYQRSIGAAQRVGANSSLSESARASISYRIGKRINTNLSGSVSRRTYDTPAAPSALLAGKEETRAIRGTVSTDIGRLASLSLSASHEDVRTDVQTLDYSSEKIGVTIATRF
jgi:hypothetical protein